jgi:hypothetical protein
MLKINKLIQKNYSKKNTIVKKMHLNFKNFYTFHKKSTTNNKNTLLILNRFLRKLPTSSSTTTKPPNYTPTKNDETIRQQSAIETVYKKIDINSSEYDKSLSTIARLALQQDKSILVKNGGESLVNDKGEIEIKQLKFSYDPTKSVLDNLDSSKIEKSKQSAVEIVDKFIKDKGVLEKSSSSKSKEYEDPNVPISKINCCGCGALLQCQNKTIEGFMKASKFKAVDKKDLRYSICLRCEVMRTKNSTLNLTANPIDYDKLIIEKLLTFPKVHVVILVDLLDMPNSIYKGWSKLIKNKIIDKENRNNLDICILGNKFDLLPHTGPLFEKSVHECLIKMCEERGLKGEQIKYVDVISAKTGFNVEKCISKFFDLWNDEGDVYLLGMANAGKSVLFNQLLSSDYCRSLASEALERATTSFWPGTTINNLKFPIRFMNEHKQIIRNKRIFQDHIKLENIETERRKVYDKSMDLKHAECLGIVGSSFKPFSVIGDEVNTECDSSYSLDPETGRIQEGENFIGINDMEQKRRNEAREIYNPNFYRETSTWFYDTFGVLGSQEILNRFSKQEIQIVHPLGIIMPRIYWMVPGQSLFVGGLMRIDLLEVKNRLITLCQL